MLFFPFYGHEQIPMSVKTAFSFLLTLFLFPLASIKNGEIYYLAVEIVSEAALGVCAGLLLYIVFAGRPGCIAVPRQRGCWSRYR